MANCKKARDAIDVALCLWLGIDCADVRHAGARSWPERDTIGHFVLKRRFDVSTNSDPGDYIKYFPSKFRAARFDEISGIRIEQTYYLDQHLRFNEELRTVQIFMDVPWLRAMVDRFQTAVSEPKLPDMVAAALHGQISDAQSGADHQGHSYPPSLAVETRASSEQAPNNDQTEGAKSKTTISTSRNIPMVSDPASDRTSAAKDLLPIFEEALRTLDILFPDWDSKTIAFVDSFRDNGKAVPWFILDDMAPQIQQGLHIFRYWRSRLTTLIIEHQSPPRDLRHIWNDRRNPMAFWTFWIGMAIFILTFVFGTIASVLAGLALTRSGIQP